MSAFPEKKKKEEMEITDETFQEKGHNEGWTGISMRPLASSNSRNKKTKQENASDSSSRGKPPSMSYAEREEKTDSTRTKASCRALVGFSKNVRRRKCIRSGNRTLLQTEDCSGTT